MGDSQKCINKTYHRISDLRKEITLLKRNVVSAEESVSKTQAELDAAEGKLMLLDGEPVVEAKEALFSRALEEIEALFLSMYKSFSYVLTGRLHEAFGDKESHRSNHADGMTIDLEDSSAMDLDQENGGPKKSNSTGGRVSSGYIVTEKEQWCLSTLGYVKAFSRQYASEIWPHIEKLQTDLSGEDTHPLFLKALY
ncbi:hypothetical protein AgCh_013773 [Apium graveolens]